LRRALHDRVGHRRRGLEQGDVPAHPGSVAGLHDEPALDQEPELLLDHKRHAAGALGEVGAELARDRPGAQKRSDELAHA
jgi:hypothetical protein